MFINWEDSITNISFLPILINRFNAISVKLPEGFFYGNWQAGSKIDI